MPPVNTAITLARSLPIYFEQITDLEMDSIKPEVFGVDCGAPIMAKEQRTEHCKSFSS
jgi:hypothetical protein